MSEQASTYLYLIRHGESAINTDPSTYGGRQNESPLTEKGVQQAQRLGMFLVRHTIVPTQVYSSPAVRAAETARHSLLVAGIEVPIQPEDDLQELHRGDWTRRKRDEVKHDTALQEQLLREGMNYRPAGGESMRDVFTRMTDWANRVRDPAYTPDRPQRIFAYGHSNSIGCFVAATAGRERIYTDSIPIGQASLSVFLHDGGRWQTEAVNVDTQTAA